MCRKMICLVSFVSVLALVLTNFAQADLIGYWRFDESSGTIAADNAGGDNDGILFGDQLEWTAGRFGGALSHGGLWDAGVEFPTTGMSATTGTVAMWGVLADPQPAHTKYFFGHTTQRQWTNRVQLYMDEGDNLLDIGLGDSHTRDTDIMELPIEEWLHVALTWDSGNYVVYVNGENVATGTYTGLSDVNEVANIGNDGSSWPYEGFAGLLDEVRLYDHALNAAEILDAMEGVEFGAAPAALPEGWQSRDIETTGGSAAEIDGIWAISADGDDVWWKSDEFRYAFMPLSGDGTIVARVVDNGTGSDSWAKGGVMIRETLNQNSKYAIMAITGGDGGGKAFQHRPITGQPSLSAHGGYQVEPPLWVRLTREGNTFTGYYSVDGFNWVEQENWSLDGDDMAQNPATIEMATDVYIGLFVTSHRSGEIRTYTFDNVIVIGVPVPVSAHIILVTKAEDRDLDGLRDDHTLESFLVSEGYSVDVRPDYWKVLTPDKIDELNAADLIIFSRLAWSSHYDDGNETTQWNSLTTPLLQMNSHFARNTRWKWVNSENATNNTTAVYLEAVRSYHPIFIDMLLSSYDPDGRPDVVQMIDPLVGTGLTSFIGSTDMGNGQLIAKPLGFEMGWIAEWDVGVEFFKGAGQYAGGRRMLFCAGTREIRYYDYDRQEVITTAQGELNLTAEGLQMFRNAITYLLNIEPASISDGHVYLFENVGGDVPDDSANSHTANLIGSPQVVDGLKGKALQFNGVDDGVHIPDAATINLSTHQNRTVVAIFQCADVTKPEKQVVYEEGGTTRGLTIYVHEGLVYTGGWNLSDYTPEWTGTYLSAPISSNVWYAVAMVVRDGGAGQEDDKFEMWMDGELISKGPGAELRPRTDDCGIGYHNSQVKFHA